MSDKLSADLASLRIDRGGSRSGGGGGWIRTLIAAALLLGVVLLAIQVAPAIEARFFKVEVETTEVLSVSPVQAAISLTATGYVIPQVTARVGSKIIGRIVEAPVREGDAVTAGQLMFRVDATDQQRTLDTALARVDAARTRVDAARAAADEVRQQLARESALLADGAVSESIVSDLKARLHTLETQIIAANAEARTAEAEVSASRQLLTSYEITAPLDGTIVNKPAAVGDVAFPEASLAELADFSTLLVEADVPEARLHLVTDGAPCEIALDAQPGERYAGTVIGLGPRLNRSKATATVKVRFEAPPSVLRPEMSARVSFLSSPVDEATRAAPPKLVLPAGTMVERQGQQGVFVLDDGKVDFVPVKTGEAVGSGVELVSGPPAGTRIIKNPPPVLADGQAVKEKAP